MIPVFLWATLHRFVQFSVFFTCIISCSALVWIMRAWARCVVQTETELIFTMTPLVTFTFRHLKVLRFDFVILISALKLILLYNLNKTVWWKFLLIFNAVLMWLLKTSINEQWQEKKIAIGHNFWIVWTHLCSWWGRVLKLEVTGPLFPVPKKSFLIWQEVKKRKRKHA